MGASFVTPERVADEILDTVRVSWPVDEQERRNSQRWVVSIKDWHPSGIEWRFLQSLLPSHDVLAIEGFHHLVDRKRGIVSRLMQRRCVAYAAHMDDETVRIARTKGRKPFAAREDASSSLLLRRSPTIGPNFNFNVSLGHTLEVANHVDDIECSPT